MTAVRDHHGVTLVELLVAIFISSFVFLIGGTLFYLLIGLGSQTMKNIETEANFSRIITALRSSALFGLNVRYVGNFDLNGTGSNSGQGYLRAFTYNDLADATGPVALMYFAQEHRRSSDTGVSGIVTEPRHLAVFFEPPTVSSPGALVVDYGRTGGGPVQVLSLDGRDEERITDLVAFSLHSPQFQAGSRILLSIQADVTLRYFIGSRQMKARKWCPPGSLATPVCSDSAPFKDLQRSFTLKFANNKTESLLDGFEFPYGLYFFKPQREL